MSQFRRVLARVLVLLFVLAVFAAPALAQGEAPQPAFDWQLVVALLINGALVTAAVQAVKVFAPKLPREWKSILPLIAGPLLTLAGTSLSGLLGHPIDLSPIAGALAGLSAGLVGMGLYSGGRATASLVSGTGDGRRRS